MRPYPRPLLKSSRVRHFAAGIGAAFLLVALTAASTVGISPADTSEGIMALSIDVQDLPCDEPFDENERVLVEPDTVNGQIRMHVTVRNRDCCCCGSDDIGMLQGTRGSVAPERVTPTVEPDLVSNIETEVREPAVLNRLGRAPIASSMGPGLAAVGAPNPVVTTSDRVGVPWWIALAAAPAILLFGRDSGEVCVDDETGSRSGPSRTC